MEILSTINQSFKAPEEIKNIFISFINNSLLDLMTKECFLNKEPENLNIVIKKCYKEKK